METHRERERRIETCRETVKQSERQGKEGDREIGDGERQRDGETE